jgi:hypothetical protein
MVSLPFPLLSFLAYTWASHVSYLALLESIATSPDLAPPHRACRDYGGVGFPERFVKVVAATHHAPPTSLDSGPIKLCASRDREGREERNRDENAAATSHRHYRSGSVNWVGGASAVPGKVGIASRLLKGPRGALNCSPVRADHRRSPWPGLYMLPSPVRYPSPDSQSALL